MAADEMTPLERDLLNLLVTGAETHADGSPICWGAWMTACAESLRARGFVALEIGDGMVGFFATPAGERALDGKGITQ